MLGAIEIYSDPIAIRCLVDDDGEFAIPAEAMDLLPDTSPPARLEVRPRTTTESYDETSDRRTVLVAEARFGCWLD